MSDDYRERLEEMGVPPDAVAGLAESIVDQRFKALEAGLGAINKAQADPWFVANQHAIGNWLNGRPEVQERSRRISNVDPEAGLDYMVTLYRAENGGGRPAGSGRSHSFYTQPLPQQHMNEVESAREEYQRTGSREAKQRFIKGRLRQVISDDFLNA